MCAKLCQIHLHFTVVKILLEVLLSSLLLEAGLLPTLDQVSHALWLNLENPQACMVQPVCAAYSSAAFPFY